MGNRRREGLARKRRRKRLSFYTPPPPPELVLNPLDMAADQAEIELFLSIRRFQWLINDIKKRIYRKPQNAFRQRRKTGVAK